MMVMKKFLFILLLLPFGCSKSDTDVPEEGYAYYPVEKGNFIIYQYTEIFYNDFNQTSETTQYYLKEVIDSAFLDGEGRPSFLLKRYNKFNDTLNWNLADVWTITPGSQHLERMEENVTYVALNFPLRRNKTWDGNVRNALPEESYEVLNLDFNWTHQGLAFSNVCRVSVRENINLIEEQVKEIVYARDIGPVFIADKDLRKKIDSTIESGYDRTWVYLTHGRQ